MGSQLYPIAGSAASGLGGPKTETLGAFLGPLGPPDIGDFFCYRRVWCSRIP
jgi:hypothetical protein